MANSLKVRSVVTGHDDQGKAIIRKDDNIDVTPYGDGNDAAFALIWTTDTSPEDNLDDLDGCKREVALTSQGGSVLRIVDMFPGKSSPMHRTQSLDYGIVLQGEIELELDDGVAAQLKAGDVIVQRGTIHAWNNKSDKLCRIAFVLLDAKPVTVGETALNEVNA